MPKADPQGMGSAITYARRYALTAMLGMITEDDDAESAKLPAHNIQTGKTTPTNSRQTGRAIHQASKAQDEFSDENKSLPELEGVTYQQATAQDGRQCIIATGNTHPKKEILRRAGFSWNAQRKIWWKYADAA